MFLVGKEYMYEDVTFHIMWPMPLATVLNKVHPTPKNRPGEQLAMYVQS